MNIKKLLISKPVLLLELAILVYFAVNVGQEMYKRRGIESQIKKLESEIGQLEKNKSDLNDLLSYVQTDAFVEQEAREKLNLAKVGESLVLVPNADNPDAILNSPEPSAQPVAAARSREAPSQKSNLVKWWQYFFEHELK